MTKMQLRQTYDEWNKEITKLNERKAKFFCELQELCGEINGGKPNNIEMAVIYLLSASVNIYTIMDLISEYYRIEGQQEALKKLALATDNFAI